MTILNVLVNFHFQTKNRYRFDALIEVEIKDNRFRSASIAFHACIIIDDEIYYE